MSLTHCSDSKFLVTKHEDEATASEEETSQSFRWRPGWQDRARGSQPEEEVGQAPKDGEAG